MDELKYPALRETVRHCVLPNGLNVYVDVKPDYGRQFAFFAVRCGGMDLRFRGEDGSWVDAPAGTAHFLEHKAFDTRVHLFDPSPGICSQCYDLCIPIQSIPLLPDPVECSDPIHHWHHMV